MAGLPAVPGMAAFERLPERRVCVVVEAERLVLATELGMHLLQVRSERRRTRADVAPTPVVDRVTR